MNNYTTSSQGDSENLQPKTFEDLRKSIQPIEWAWNNWLPRGLLTIVAAESGAGKSALCLRLAACFTNGWNWPDDTICIEGGSVIWCEAESSQAVNLQRAIDWGMNLSKLLIPLGDPLQDVYLDSKNHREQIKKLASRQDVKLIVVDSLSGANNRDENTTKMLGLTKWIAQLGRDHNVPVLLTHHLRKKGMLDNDIVTLDRLRGSSAIPQAARVVWALDNPNSNDGFKRLSVIKSNIGLLPEPIGFKFSDLGVEFGQTPKPIKCMTAQDEASEFIRNILIDGSIEATHIYETADKFGIQERTLNAAKKLLGVRSRKEKGKDGKWFWEMPHS